MLSVTCGAMAFLAGTLVVVGWLTHTPVLLRWAEGFVAIVASSGLCLALGGLALASAAWTSDRASRWSLWPGMVLTAIAVAMLLEMLPGIELGVDLAGLHAWLQDSNPNPGRMAPNTALGFGLMGLGLLAEEWVEHRPWVGRFQRACGIAVAILGFSGLLTHFVHPELLFGWHRNMARMAPYAGLGTLLLGIGGYARWRGGSSRPDDLETHRRHIFQTAAIALAVAAVITGTAGLASQLNSVTESAHEHLSRSLSDRRLLLEQALAGATQKVELTRSNPAVTAHLMAIASEPSLDVPQLALRSIAERLLPNGFSYVAFEGRNGVVASAGQAMVRPSMDVSLQGVDQGSLAWQSTFVMRHRLPVLGPEGLIGHVVTEQPLQVLSLLSAEMSQWGRTYDMALCADDRDHIRCFPQRQSRDWFRAPKLVKGQPLPMSLALEGHVGVTQRLDFRQHQVIAAYAPVGTSGLGMVLKVDAAELYEPARGQMLMALPIIVLTVLAGLWALRWRLRPVVQELVVARQAARANEARFVAAMESSLDAFYILRAERDERGEIVDFRFTYVTVRGAALVSLTPEQVEGQLLCELLPINRTSGFLDKYKKVVDSGIVLAEEFPIQQDGVVATWISHQIVKLGDDSIAITSRDISARKRDEQALVDSEERLRMVTDSVPALIAYLDMNERYLFINQGGAELYGQPVEDIVGKTVLEVVGPDNYALMKPHIEVVAAGYPVTYERQVSRPDGIRHVMTCYFPQYDDHGNVTHVCALANDITERKQMEAELAVSQERLKAVTDNVPALISYIDREHRFRFANLAYKEWLGVDPDTLIGRSLPELYGEGPYARILGHLERALSGETLSYERDLETPQGLRHAHVTMTPHRNSSGDVVGLYVLMNDITPLKKAEQQSARSEERLSMALEGSHLALFDWNIQTHQVYHSAHWSSMLGGPLVETTTSFLALAQLVHPEDQPLVQAKIAGALKGTIPFYSVEHRVRTHRGDWLWILSRGRVVERDADGRALRLSGTNADITEQKRIEVQLQRMAEIDALTGLPNRVLFNDRLQRALERVRRNGTHMALLLLDVDYFKQINDGMGHDAGDAVLQEFAQRLSSTVRMTDTVARLGGDEFTIILEELHEQAEAEMIAAKVVAAMMDDFIHAGSALKVTASIGVAYLERPDEDLAKLIKRADQALYSAKAAGRNTYRSAAPPILKSA